MGWSLKIARVAGTEIRIHITFLLFLAWIGWADYQAKGAEAAFQGVLFMSLLFLCVLLHELGHALAARMFGIPTPDITLLPIGGVARLQRMPEKPVQEIIVALAGPAVNVVMAALPVAGAGASVDPSQLQNLTGAGGLASRLATLNLVLVLFNLIPAFPMDGGRVLRAVVATQTTYGRATRIAAGIGQGFAFLFGLLGLFWNPMLIFTALFLYTGASQEAAVASLKDHEFPIVDPAGRVYRALQPGGPYAFQLMQDCQRPALLVVDRWGRLVGMVTTENIPELKGKRKSRLI